MQGFHSAAGVSGGGGSGIFGGVDLRRPRGYPSAASPTAQPPLKCPRCESTNTKFCYYNNYNLSQPRHFCKSCRRYWTKGGVLRNVPVGGGCRKTKRPCSAASSGGGGKDRRRSAVSRSNSDNSTLTASDQAYTSVSEPANPNLDTNSSLIGGFIQVQEIFPETNGSFASLIEPELGLPEPATLSAGESKVAGEIKQKGFLPEILDHTVQTVDLPPYFPTRAGGDGVLPLTGLDWTRSGDSSLFDLTATVDPSPYWNQSHWGDTDPALYLP